MAAVGQFAMTAVLGADLRVWREPWILWGSLAIVAILLLGAYIIWLVDRWRKRPTDERLPAGSQLTHFRKLYEQGEISAEEFARIRARLADRLVQELDEAPEPPKPSPPEGGPGSPKVAQPEPPPSEGRPASGQSRPAPLDPPKPNGPKA